MTKRKKKSLKFESSLAIDETSLEIVTLVNNAEFTLKFINGGVLIIRDNGLTGDFWVTCIKSAMFDRLGGPTPLEKRQSSRKLKMTKKKV